MGLAEEITLTAEDRVATIRIDRVAKKNALTFDHFQRLADLVGEVANDVETRVLVVTGSGDSFCSGADLTGTHATSVTVDGPLQGTQWMRMINRAATALHRCPKPTIAAVNGVAAGAGCNLALGCDLVVASESARFSEIFVKRGLNLDFGGTWLLPRLVGLQKARLLAFFGDIVSAKEADELGLLARLVPDGELDAAVADLAGRLTALPPVPLMLMKHGLNESFGWTMQEALDYEAHAQTLCFGTQDLVEAMSAWMQKRPGSYTGR